MQDSDVNVRSSETPHKERKQTVPDPFVVESVQLFIESEQFPSGIDPKAFRLFVESASSNAGFPRAFFDVAAIRAQYTKLSTEGEEIPEQGEHLDQSFLHGLSVGIAERKETEGSTGKTMMANLESSAHKNSSGPVDISRTKSEMEILGFLLGRKVAMNDDLYVPMGVDFTHTPSLKSLERFAQLSCSAFQHTEGMKKISTMFTQIPDRK